MDALVAGCSYPFHMPTDSVDIAPWTQIEQVIDAGEPARLEAFLKRLAPADTPYAINRLSEPHQTKLLSMVRPELAAQLMEHLEDAQAADLIEELPPPGAAAIVDEMDSDDQADILFELDRDDAEAILNHMNPAEAADARRLASFAPDTTGGLMISEYLAYRTDQSVGDVLDDLRDHVDAYSEFDVQYIYATDGKGLLKGLIRIRDIVLAPGHDLLATIMQVDPAHANVSDSVDVLANAFDRYSFNALPVTDAAGRLVGVVRRAAAEEALGERSDRTLLRFGGIVAGEELRSMGLASRAARRLLFLVPNVLLMVLSISVIAFFEDLVLQQVIALAIFLPLVAGIAGSAANQALAVSIRELSLGVTRPRDMGWVLSRETQVGLINGAVLAVVVFAVVMAMRRDTNLAFVVAASIPLTILLAVIVGGAGPLLLHRINIDPAMASGPIITTVVDFFGFLLVLSIAWWTLGHLL